MSDKQDTHAVGFHDDAGRFCSDFGLFTLFFGKLDASEIGSKGGPIREEQQAPESVISGWSLGFPTRLLRRGHTSPPARFTAGAPPQGNHPGPSKPHHRYLSRHLSNALITRCRTFPSDLSSPELNGVKIPPPSPTISSTNAACSSHRTAPLEKSRLK